ncbi:hypothetical protein RB608_20760 [Nocardioides sp. LHD-245]|uniref:hypothetical protein n=1 Tax=Nocardioides sp. LHD-245 TaxID=3051387 RepID=UPI0027E1B6A0|nr:hypothetical protein [Nocardioides sp. LHD-245]
MNSEARKRADHAAATDPRAEVRRLAEAWDREADHEDARGNGFAAVILHAHARELRAALDELLIA